MIKSNKSEKTTLITLIHGIRLSLSAFIYRFKRVNLKTFKLHNDHGITIADKFTSLVHVWDRQHMIYIMYIKYFPNYLFQMLTMYSASRKIAENVVAEFPSAVFETHV